MFPLPIDTGVEVQFAMSKVFTTYRQRVSMLQSFWQLIYKQMQSCFSSASVSCSSWNSCFDAMFHHVTRKLWRKIKEYNLPFCYHFSRSFVILRDLTSFLIQPTNLKLVDCEWKILLWLFFLNRQRRSQSCAVWFMIGKNWPWIEKNYFFMFLLYSSGSGNIHRHWRHSTSGFLQQKNRLVFCWEAWSPWGFRSPMDLRWTPHLKTFPQAVHMIYDLCDLCYDVLLCTDRTGNHGTKCLWLSQRHKKHLQPQRRLFRKNAANRGAHHTMEKVSGGHRNQLCASHFSVPLKQFNAVLLKRFLSQPTW